MAGTHKEEVTRAGVNGDRRNKDEMSEQQGMFSQPGQGTINWPFSQQLRRERLVWDLKRAVI